ncbi:MAG: hypothetical protein KIT72_13765 [Polyangiaceae bacterium]|nr:hypothetical protein [Polyangiaceae bacterium]MCW5791478.1 hypothetical protein [Polyangiaceae bacterium]
MKPAPTSAKRGGSLAALFGVAALAVACSVTNTFDEVRQSSAGGSGASGGAGAAGGVAGSGGTLGGTTAAGTGGTAGVDPAPAGLIMVAGVGDGEAGRESVIAALSPHSGREYARRSFGAGRSVRVAYDAATDVWYVFAQVGTVTEPFELHTLRFDRVARRFTELATLTVPAPKGVIAVLNQRLYYQSVVQEVSAPPTEGFTLVRVVTPEAPELVQPPQDTPLLSGTVFAMVSRPSAAPGGVVNVFIKDASCPAGVGGPACDVRVRRASIREAATTAQFAVESQVLGRVLQSGGSAAATRAGDDDVIVLPDPSWVDGLPDVWAGQAQRFHSTTFATLATYPFEVNGPAIRDAAWDACSGVVFATELAKDAAIFAIPTASGGTTFRLGVSTPPVAAVHFEPITRSVLQPKDDPTNYSIRAFALGGTSLEPVLTERLPGSALPWEPPPDLRPIQVAIEEPRSPACP